MENEQQLAEAIAAALCERDAAARKSRLGERLIATASEVALRSRTGVYDVEVCNEAGAKPALFRGNSFLIEGSVLDHA